MHGHNTDRKKRDMLDRIVALLFAFAVIAERAGAMPAPVRCLALFFLWRAEFAAHTYVHWTARDCGAPLQWALPDAARNGADREAALALAWWFRILAVALRDLPRRAFAVRMARMQWRIDRVRAPCSVGLVRSGGLAIGRPIGFDTS